MKRGWASVVALALVCLGGCAGPQVDDSGSTAPVAASDLGVTQSHEPKVPPLGTGGGPSASGCGGVTEKGRCELSDTGQVAVVCDVAGNKVQKFDCSAMKKVCVLDSTRGASCTTLPPPAPPASSSPRDMATASPPAPAAPRDMALPPTPPAPPAPRDMATSPPAPRDMATAPPMCASGVDYRGYCASASGAGAYDTAIWCDPSTGQTLVINCAVRGQTCQVDGCADGAYCCDTATPVDMAPPPAMDEDCTGLGYDGACGSGHARWCSGGQLLDIDCGARGQDCMVDTCAQGAYCCDAPAPPSSDPPASGECDLLGTTGECSGDTARWCSGGQLVEIDCAGRGQRCEVDTCASGAYCCSD